jgi:hypothetical protein
MKAPDPPLSAAGPVSISYYLTRELEFFACEYG